MSQNNDKEKPAGSQSLFRGLMLIEILSNYPNGCPLAHLSELAGLEQEYRPSVVTGASILRIRDASAGGRKLPSDDKVYCRRPKSPVIAEYHPRCGTAP